MMEETARTKIRPGTVAFGSGWRDCGGRTLTSPRDVFVAHEIDDVRPALANACAAAEAGLHVAGFVAYEAAPAFDAAMSVRPPSTPLVWMAAYDERRFGLARSSGSCPDPSDARFAYDAKSYRKLVSVLRRHIYEGDVYQINFTGSVDFTLTCDPYTLFRHLLQRQPVPFAAFVDTGDVQVLSCSPELFFERHGRRVASRPMKGTVRRGRDPEEDGELERWLSHDEKSRAENLMIVDLLRNDLSRCCDPGTVRVPELFATERYRTVIQMTSQIEGRLCSDASTEDLFSALFPCGSVTGAPKVRAMELIRRFESEPRGVYCGAVGYMRGDRAVFNVAIRTVTVRGKRARMGVGSGIVWDSDAEKEYEECLLKGRFLSAGRIRSAESEAPRPMQAVSGPGYAAARDDGAPLLIETMRSRDDVIQLLERHVDRLRSSAAALGYPFDEAAFRRSVARATPHDGTYKIRATLSHGGGIVVEANRLERSPAEWRTMISDVRIDASDEYRRHKTTWRAPYDAAYRSARSEGYDEVIFLNDRGEVAEGSRTNVFAVFGDRWVTPPVHCGALPGVYRRFLLETRVDTEEGVLTLDDLCRAEAVYLCNAVRGLARTHLSLAPEIVRDDVR